MEIFAHFQSDSPPGAARRSPCRIVGLDTDYMVEPARRIGDYLARARAAEDDNELVGSYRLNLGHLTDLSNYLKAAVA